MVPEWLDISIGGMFVFVPPLQQHQTNVFNKRKNQTL
jgi:hypothetical protein